MIIMGNLPNPAWSRVTHPKQVGAFPVAKPLSPPAQQVGEGEGEGRRVVRSGKARHAVTSPRRARAAQQQRGQRGEGEYEGGEGER